MKFPIKSYEKRDRLSLSLSQTLKVCSASTWLAQMIALKFSWNQFHRKKSSFPAADQAPSRPRYPTQTSSKSEIHRRNISNLNRKFDPSLPLTPLPTLGDNFPPCSTKTKRRTGFGDCRRGERWNLFAFGNITFKRFQLRRNCSTVQLFVSFFLLHETTKIA